MVKVGDNIEVLNSSSGVVYAINKNWIYYIDSMNTLRACTSNYVREIANDKANCGDGQELCNRE